MKRIELLDYGRLIAALSVVFFHYFFNGIHNGKISSINHIDAVVEYAKYGYLGVEFFFMISGYVIFYSASKKDAAGFIAARMLRLFPAYWAGVLITTIFSIFIATPSTAVTLVQFLANLTMFPKIMGQEFVDGVYWTLQYEWLFYFSVSILLLAGFQKRLMYVFIVWPILILLVKILGLKSYLLFGGEFNYFAAGAIFAIAHSSKRKSLYLIILLCLYLCISFSIDKSTHLSNIRDVLYSPLVIALIITCQFLFFLCVGFEWFSNLELPFSKLAGNLTYPLYLIHAHLGYMLLSNFANDQNQYVIYLASFILVFFLAYLINLYVEKRLHEFWKQLFNKYIERPIRWLHNIFIRKYATAK